MSRTTIKTRIRNAPGSFFLGGYLLVLPVLLYIALAYPGDAIHLVINGFHTEFLDKMMRYWTCFGDGLFLFILVLGLLTISFRYFFTGLAAFSLSGLIAQILKHAFFSEFARPVKYFEIHHPGHQLYLVPGVDMYTWLSFPSGHTATSFALFFALALLTRSRLLQILSLIIALGVGYSRMYLSQHFLMDVVGGSILGVITGWLAWYWFRRYHGGWIDRSLINVLKK